MASQILIARAVLEKEAPGIAEALRVGSPGGVRDGLEVLNQLVDHAELVTGVKTSH